ncbi:hypothetical protein MARBORIA2_14630 [Methanobrevibacter arboriphilus]|jgi:hypothetical protein|uniref:hypothetical protein n=1 Tax=Methanobrevibacter arboriphilus TaxID=39441 RepID=UPI0022EFB083|nr:hypothetical protein [Methanobrevibacter arboriphilus]GLI12373.1 hypothetical protein MARBORIA2_14630 [Methanobrevibacter arboriphilus]
MKYGKQAIARVNDETNFKIKKIKQYKGRVLREIICLGIEKYENDNPAFAKKVKLEWIDHQLGLVKNKQLDDDYEIEKLMKEHYKIIMSFDKFKKAIEDYYIDNLDDFINAFYEVKQLIGDNGDLDSVDNKELRLLSGTYDIPLNDLVGASKELLEVLNEE